MHIKKIVIDGFKSYGEHTVVGPLDPGSNVFVGVNGSGKSNFFAAIQFVLSDEFSPLQKEQQHSLLHDGTAPRSITASVEIIFDNSDKRISVDKNEVSLKRIIGTKKDQYLLNKSVISRAEVVSLLETAGFSKSNPYYIVQQGKINELAMTSESRLKLLKEIAGVQVYENKRKESLSIVQGTQLRIRNIESLLQTINEKLETLRNETNELKEFQQLDKKMRTIEHIIYDRELSKNKDKIKEVERLYSTLQTKQAQLEHSVTTFLNKKKDINHLLKRAQRVAETVDEEKVNLSNELEKLLAERESNAIKVDDLMQEIETGNNNQELVTQDLEKVNKDIEEADAKLKEIIPQYEDKVKSEEDIIRQLDALEQSQQLLYARQNRGVQFQTKEERNKWINKELTLINQQVEEKIEHIKNLESFIDKNNSDCSDLEKLNKNVSDDMEHQYKAIDKFRRDIVDLNKKRDELSAIKKDLCKKENSLRNDIAYLEEDLKKINQNMISCFGKEIFNGINSVNKVLKTFSERGDMNGELHKYLGLVIESFECSPAIYKAVEVTVGSRLFFHIVTDIKFGQEILREMNQQQLPGVVTFIPLNRIKEYTVFYPEMTNAMPLISKLTYNKNCEIPMRYIFGKIILSRDIRICTQIAASGKFDCVTLDGDQASSKGWLQGGYHGVSKSPMNLQQEKINVIQKMDYLRQEMSKVCKEITDIDSDIIASLNDANHTETKYTKARETYEKLTDDLETLKKELQTLENDRASQIKRLKELESDLINLQTLRKKLNEELEQDLNDQLTETEERQIKVVNESGQQLRKDLKKIFEERKKFEKEKLKIENLLNGNLNCKKKHLQRKQREISIGLKDNELNLQEVKHQYIVIEEKILACKNELKQNEMTLKNSNTEKQRKLEELEILSAELIPVQQEFEEHSEALQRLSAKKLLLEECSIITARKIVELGSLANSDLYSKYQDMNTNTLYKKLNNCRKHLKNYEHVNKKAQDQYEIFKDQKENLFKRKQEVDTASQKIQELFDFLQQKKNEAVQFTFKQVSKYFADIFKKLVHSGKAELLMLQDNSQSDNDSTTLDVDKIKGVGISVSFIEQTSAMVDYNTLSGGQKSLVALALIFAIQKCDPAPFYLFDEIDRDLDVDHRRAVSQMIHELSSEAQFIIITHRPELLEIANKCYGVKFQSNKISSIFDMSYNEALNFIAPEEE